MRLVVDQDRNLKVLLGSYRQHLREPWAYEFIQNNIHRFTDRQLEQLYVDALLARPMIALELDRRRKGIEKYGDDTFRKLKLRECK